MIEDTDKVRETLHQFIAAIPEPIDAAVCDEIMGAYVLYTAPRKPVMCPIYHIDDKHITTILLASIAIAVANTNDADVELALKPNARFTNVVAYARKRMVALADMLKLRATAYYVNAHAYEVWFNVEGVAQPRKIIIKMC